MAPRRVAGGQWLRTANEAPYMETRRLEYFVRIVDAGSISRAAQDLSLIHI